MGQIIKFDFSKRASDLRDMKKNCLSGQKFNISADEALNLRNHIYMVKAEQQRRLKSQIL